MAVFVIFLKNSSTVNFSYAFIKVVPGMPKKSIAMNLRMIFLENPLRTNSLHCSMFF